MSKTFKNHAISGIVSGLIYAGFMAAIDYSNGQDFNTWRFISNALFLGILMGLSNYYSLKKYQKKNFQNEEEN